MLKFVDGADIKVQNLIAVIYGCPNAGKTTLALSASKPILLDFDGGAHRAGNKRGKAIVRINEWKDVDFTSEDLKPFDTVVIDTVGTCLNYLSRYIIEANPKMGRMGGLTMQGYGELKRSFSQFLTNLILSKKDVVMIAHMKEEQQGDQIVERIVATGSSRDEVYQQADIMGRISIEDDMRYISFNPASNAYGKNVGLPRYALGADSMVDQMEVILKKAKILINDQAEDNKQEIDRVEKLKSWISGLTGDADQFNEYMETLKEANARPNDKKLFLEQAEKCGLTFDKANGKFLAPEPPF